MNDKKAFTLLELIVVIVIVGVMAGVALPKLFHAIEFSRSTEAMSAMAALRHAAERCYLMNNGSYRDCCLNNRATCPDKLDIEDPGKSPDSHFTYRVGLHPNLATHRYILAYRNTLSGGNGPENAIQLFVQPTDVSWCGWGDFESIGSDDCGGDTPPTPDLTP